MPKKQKIDIDKKKSTMMMLDYMHPNVSLRDIAKKYKVTINTVHFYSQKFQWTKKKREVHEQALCDAVIEWGKKHKNALLKDLDKITGIEDKVFKKLSNSKNILNDFKVKDLVALIKLKYEIIANFSTNKQIINNTNNIQEGDTTFNFNISDTEIDVKLANLFTDLKQNKTLNNRMKVLKADNK